MKKFKRVPVYHPCGRCEVTFDYCRCDTASELEFLRFFYQLSYRDTRNDAKERFVRKTGNLLPQEYNSRD